NGLELTGTFTNLISSTTFTVTNAGAGTFASNLIVQGTTGLTFNTGAGGDITFANGEKIDNDTNGTVAITGDLDVSSHIALGNGGTVSTGYLIFADGNDFTSCGFSNCIGINSTPEDNLGLGFFGNGRMIAFFGRSDTAAAAITLENSVAFYAENPVKGAGSTITNAIGYYVSPQTSGTNNYGICFDCDGTFGTNTVGSGIQWGTDSPAQLFRSGANTLSVGATTGLTSTGALTITGGSTLTLNSTTASTLTIDSGTTGQIDIGVNNNSKTINIGTGTAVNTINIGTGGATSAETLTIGSTDTDTSLVLNAGGGSTAINFPVFDVDTAGMVLATNTTASTTATTEAVNRSSVTTVTLASGGSSFANNDVIRTIRSSVYYFARIVSGGGTNSWTVTPAVSYDSSSTVTKWTAQNIGATQASRSSDKRYFQGFFLGGVVTGSASTTYSDLNISFLDASTFNFTDDSGNTLMSLADAGTTGNLTVSGTLTATGGLSGTLAFSSIT
ncbi:MAG: hypothetical protein Q7T74_05570, partial [Candidatus Saccharibacteria bacterium]|nr:hypothetical protein [Candidatus Saccharibacteria bacterium]